MVADRLLLPGRIAITDFTAFRSPFPWRSESRGSLATVGGNPTLYDDRTSRIGKSLLRVTRRTLELEAIPTTKEAKILDARPINAGEVLDAVERDRLMMPVGTRSDVDC